MAEVSVNVPDHLAAQLELLAELERTNSADLASRAVEVYLQQPHAIEAIQAASHSIDAD